MTNLDRLNSDSLYNYEQSVDLWNELKVKNGNSYIYQRAFTSWTRHGFMTEIKVENGIVTERKYQSFQYNGKTKIIKKSYVEKGNKIGSHDEGFDAVTIDDLYKTCAAEYLVVDTALNEIYFETNEDGIMTICGYYSKGCADDCYQGVSLFGFKWLNE